MCRSAIAPYATEFGARTGRIAEYCLESVPPVQPPLGPWELAEAMLPIPEARVYREAAITAVSGASPTRPPATWRSRRPM